MGSNSIEKNKERVATELKALWVEYKAIAGRFKYVTLWGMKTRVPVGKQGMGHPTNNELLHLLTAFVEELADQAPRTTAYLIIVTAVIHIILSNL